MDFISQEQLPLFAFMLLPGFISLRVFGLLVPAERDDASRQILNALAYSAINLALWWVPLTSVVLPNREKADPFLLWAVVISMVLITPGLLGYVAYKLLSSDRLRGVVRHPTPTAWDHFFGRCEPCWILFRLRNGKSVGGFYGPQSFASSFPNRRDLYVEQTWIVDEQGRFTRAIPGSAGALISAEDCELVEFFRTSDQDGGGTENVVK